MPTVAFPHVSVKNIIVQQVIESASLSRGEEHGMSGVTASSSTDLKKIEQDFHLTADGHGTKTFVVDTNVLRHADDPSCRLFEDAVLFLDALLQVPTMLCIDKELDPSSK